nr:hypothetical protein [uncultured Prevotella sp.]
MIDWEQRRYEIAKAVMQGLISNAGMGFRPDTFAEYAVQNADKLIKRLKKTEE